nr:hypothetical protein [Stakelama flava]
MIVAALPAPLPVVMSGITQQDQVASLDADLLRGPTATAALQRRCGDVPVRVEVDRDAKRAPDAAQRQRLQVGPDEPVSYRRVRLVCGDRLLSEAENWFVPSRLTDAMNRDLLSGTRPYGAVIAPLRPRRRNLQRERLWDGSGMPPEKILRHRALVLDHNGVPLAEVVETYHRGALHR